MKPKTKAKKLVNKYADLLEDKFPDIFCIYQEAVECALLAVNELIKLDYNTLEYYGELSSTEYWEQVRNEIIKLK